MPCVVLRRVGKRTAFCLLRGPTMNQQGAGAFTLATLPLQALEYLRGSLRAKFIIVIVALEIALMGAVTLVVEHDQHRAILEQARLRALSLGASLAALSEGYLLSYNFVQ